MQAVTAKQAMLELLAVLADSTRTASARLAAHWESLMPAFLVGYGATLRSTDQATLRLLCILNAARKAQLVPAQHDEEAHVSGLQAWGTEGAAGIGWALWTCLTHQTSKIPGLLSHLNLLTLTFHKILMKALGH